MIPNPNDHPSESVLDRHGDLIRAQECYACRNEVPTHELRTGLCAWCRHILADHNPRHTA